eukprot:9665774-Heterocapsa_arctica.AAC.1
MELALLSSIKPLSSSFVCMSMSFSTFLSVLANALVPSKYTLMCLLQCPHPARQCLLHHHGPLSPSTLDEAM